MAFEYGSTPEQVYVVLNVFDIGKPVPGLSVFVDPAAMVQNGKMNASGYWRMKLLGSSLEGSSPRSGI